MTGAELIAPVQATGTDLSPLPLPSLEQARGFIRVSKAENTLRGYQSDWRAFCAWCEGHGLCPLPAIAEAHKAAGEDSPTHHAIVRNTLKGIRRTLGTAQSRKAAVLTDEIRTMMDVADDGTIGARDRALVLLGFAGAFRRSELVGLDFEDCTLIGILLAARYRHPSR